MVIHIASNMFFLAINSEKKNIEIAIMGRPIWVRLLLNEYDIAITKAMQ